MFFGLRTAARLTPAGQVDAGPVSEVQTDVEVAPPHHLGSSRGGLGLPRCAFPAAGSLGPRSTGRPGRTTSRDQQSRARPTGRCWQNVARLMLRYRSRATTGRLPARDSEAWRLPFRPDGSLHAGWTGARRSRNAGHAERSALVERRGSGERRREDPRGVRAAFRAGRARGLGAERH